MVTEHDGSLFNVAATKLSKICHSVVLLFFLISLLTHGDLTHHQTLATTCVQPSNTRGLTHHQTLATTCVRLSVKHTGASRTIKISPQRVYTLPSITEFTKHECSVLQPAHGASLITKHSPRRVFAPPSITRVPHLPPNTSAGWKVEHRVWLWMRPPYVGRRAVHTSWTVFGAG